MSTNYYWCESHCFDCDVPTRPIHVGKSSHGWTFNFRAHPERGLVSWDAWRKLVFSGGGVIRDEYDREIHPETFEALVNSKLGGRSHANDFPAADNWLDPEGHSFSDHEFS